MAGAFSRPILLLPGQPSRTLDRASLEGRSDDAGYDEAWIQELLFHHPEALPVSEIDESFAGLVPVCRELNTPAGPIDVLYATPGGRIAFVEAKLWRNPEARRKVIGQILDYAKELSRWSYERLDAAVRQARRGAAARAGESAGLADVVRERAAGFDEPRFVDSVSRSLRRGDFLLLIVGDGIREGVGSIVEFLEGHASLHFTFGLVELAIYRLPDGGQLVQPRVLTQSTIVRRMVVSLEGTGLVAQDAGAETEAGDEQDEELREQQQYFTDFWKEFLAGLRLDDQSQPLPSGAKSTNLYFPMPRGSKAWVSAYVAKSKQRAGAFLTFERGPIADRLFQELKQDASAIERELGVPVAWEDDGEGKYRIIGRRSFPSVTDAKHRPEVLAWLRDATNRFVNVFRPRLEKSLRDEI